ncbi:MAG: hypothetical protein ISR85_03950 [Kiritimatiellales bacterium]|nr:hypothetical protein [Kiritimatiellota bacterium]MBL7012065.1 hypothetical protein [Kiritimatiellales bacterium]
MTANAPEKYFPVFPSIGKSNAAANGNNFQTLEETFPNIGKSDYYFSNPWKATVVESYFFSNGLEKPN